jgi:hypothetical protein
MTPETKLRYENFTLKWGQYVPKDFRSQFILETADIMTAFGKDCFEEFLEHMRKSNEAAAAMHRPAERSK